MKNNKSIETFFALIRAGLWADKLVHGEELIVNGSSNVDWEEVYRIAEEQSVIGVVLAGIEKTNMNRTDNPNRPSQGMLLQWIGEMQMLEQQNKEMNYFIGVLIDKMRLAGIYTLLVKGQGVAQCYDKPLWRCNGDVDFLLSDNNYNKAKLFLTSLASNVNKENIHSKHLGMTINSWVVELHGTLRCGLSPRIDKGLDEIMKSIFCRGKVKTWMNEKILVFLPNADEDVIYVFSHILEHFYKGGIGLRQICDWCRLLWTYKDSLDYKLLESRIRNMGLLTEWKTIGAFAVDYLGMPSEAMPLYSTEKKWSRKGDKFCAFVLDVGNFGHNRDNSYYSKYPFLIRKIYSFGRRCGDLIRHARIFPLDSLRFFPYMMYNGISAAING